MAEDRLPSARLVATFFPVARITVKAEAEQKADVKARRSPVVRPDCNPSQAMMATPMKENAVAIQVRTWTFSPRMRRDSTAAMTGVRAMMKTTLAALV